MALEKISLHLNAEAEIVNGKIVPKSGGRMRVTIEGNAQNVGSTLLTAMLDEHENGHRHLCDIITGAAENFNRIMEEQKSGIRKDDTGQPGPDA